MYFDAHIHLLNHTTLELAREKQVRYFILNATTHQEWHSILSLAKNEKEVYPCIGIHPWFIDTTPPFWEKEMEKLLAENPFLMIGEIGLDYTKGNKEKQKNIFENCLRLAITYNRPVHIHCVKAWHDILYFLKKYPTLKILFHKFSASPDVIHKLKDYNIYYSLQTNQNLDLLPADKILVETDSPSHEKQPRDIIQIVKHLEISPDILLSNFKNFITPFDKLITTKDTKK